MTFLSPLYLVGIAAAVIPIVLHFLHRQPEQRVKFAAVRLLRQAPVEDARKRRVREWLLLALRVGALALMAMAFARPFFSAAAAARAGGLSVVAVDTSLSMSAPGRMEKARELARAVVNHAPAGDRVSVVMFADTARVVVAPTADRSLALAAIDSARAGFGGTRYRAALNAAAQAGVSAGSAPSHIAVVTDLQASGWDSGDRAAVAESTRVEIADVGAMPPNVAITALDGLDAGAVATIRNSGPARRDVRVSLEVDGRHAADAVTSLAAGESGRVELRGGRGEVAVASIDDAPGVQADNVRYVVLNNTGRPALVVVTTNGDLGRDAFYLQQALAASGPSSYLVDGRSGDALSKSDASTIASAEAVVLASTHGLDAKGRSLLADYLRRGGGLFVAAGPDVDGDVLSEILGGAVSVSPAGHGAAPRGDRHFAPSDARHPVFGPFAGRTAVLGLATFHDITPLSSQACDAIAHFTTGEAAMLDCAVGEGRALVLASDLDNRGNDLPLRASFVPLLTESIRYLADGRHRGAAFLVGDTPPGVAPQPGFATMNGPGGSRRVAVNVDPAETDPDRISTDEFQAAVSHLKDAGRSDARVRSADVENRQHLWQYLLLLAIGVLMTESFVSMRAA